MKNRSKHTKIIITLLITLLMPFIQACSSDDGQLDNPLTPIDLSTEETQVSADLRMFSINLLKAAAKTSTEEKNVSVSPLGAAMVVGMFGNAIEVSDRTELMEVLGITDMTSLNSYCSKMLLSLPKQDKTATLMIDNGAWFNKSLTNVSESYRYILESDYKSTITMEIFNSSTTLSNINRWVNDKTHGHIPSILDYLEPSSTAVWLNSLYFRGNWVERFDKSKTQPGSFYKENGQKIKVNMMSGGKGKGGIRIAELIDPEKKVYKYPDDFYITEGACLDFGNKSFAFTALMPDDRYSSINDFVEKLTPELLNKAMKGGGYELKFPKLSLKFNSDLIEPLKEMGLRNAFINVNMPGIGNDKTSVSQFIQKINLDIDEEGSTVVAITEGGLMPEANINIWGPVVFNRPFVYFIWEKSTGAILLAGVVMDPTK